MQIPQATTPLDRYAHLCWWRDHCQRTGQNCDPSLIREISQLEQRAQALLTPQEMQIAQRRVAEYQSNLTNQRVVYEQQQYQQSINQTADKFSKEMTGLTAAQHQAVLNGQSYKVQAKHPAPQQLKAQLERMYQQSGLKLTYNEVAKLADDLQGADHDKWVGKLAPKYGKKAQQVAQAVKGAMDSGILLHIGLNEARGYDGKPEEVPVHDGDVRKAQIANNFAQKASKDRRFLQEASDTRDGIQKFHEEYSENPEEHRDYQISQAWDKVEAEGGYDDVAYG